MTIPAERQKHILEYLSQNEFGEVNALSDLIGVSPATIRRDLEELDKMGFLQRTRGGASRTVYGVGHEPSYAIRSKQNIDEKRAIANYACSLINEGDVFALDVGSTMFELAKCLQGQRTNTVFTACLPIAQLLSQSYVSVVLLGGILRKKELSVVGPIVNSIISQFHFDKFFMGISGVAVKEGFTDFSMDDVEVKKAFIEQSKEIIVLADHTKLGRVSLQTVCSLIRVDRLITNSGGDPILLEELRSSGLEITVVDTDTNLALPPEMEDEPEEI